MLPSLWKRSVFQHTEWSWLLDAIISGEGRLFVRLAGNFYADEINIVSLWTFQGAIICPLSMTFSLWMFPSTSNHCVQMEKDKYHVIVLFFWPSLNWIWKLVSQIQEKENLRTGKYYRKVVLISQNINCVFLWNILRYHFILMSWNWEEVWLTQTRICILKLRVILIQGFF